MRVEKRRKLRHILKANGIRHASLGRRESLIENVHEVKLLEKDKERRERENAHGTERERKNRKA